jgi:uncharacterized repeat protein (TIGR01451 family)
MFSLQSHIRLASCFVGLWAVTFGGTPTKAETLSNVFSGSINVSSGLVDGFFVGNGSSTTPLDGVCLGPESFSSDPLNPLNTADGLFHPSGFNPRRVMSAFNPSLNGGTIFIGIDLPGGTNSAANPNFNDGVVPARMGGDGLTAIRPFDADGNGEPETIGRKADNSILRRCSDWVIGDTQDSINCADSVRNGAFTDAATDPGVSESYVVTVTFTNGTFVTVSLIEDVASGAGSARRDITQTGGKTFGAQVSTATLGAGAGAPQGLDVLFAITNVNANVDACTRLIQHIVASAGSNRDGVGNGEPFKELTCSYVLPAAVVCEVLFYTNDVQVTTNLCGTAAPVGVPQGTDVEVRVRVTANADNHQAVSNITVSIPGCEDVVVAGPLAPGASTNVPVCIISCEVPGVQGVMASVAAEGALTEDCFPIQTSCAASLQCCGIPEIMVIKKIACADGAATCETLAPGLYADEATGVKDSACPAFCYRITVTNTGPVPLINITVVDDVLGDKSADFADTLTVGGSETHFYSATHCSNVMNTVVAEADGDPTVGVGHVMSSDSANAVVLRARISCEKTVSTNGVNFVSSIGILDDGNAHQVIYRIRVNNLSDPGVTLTNLVVSDPGLAGCDIASQVPSSLAQGASFDVFCTNLLDCAQMAGGVITNTATVSAQVDSNSGALCVEDENGEVIDVESTCLAVVFCIPCPEVTVAPVTICEGGSAQLCANVSGGTSPFMFSWTGPNNYSTNTECATIANAVPGDSGSYCVTVTDANGCVIGPVCGQLTVNPTPPCSIEPARAEVCEGNTATFCATNLVGASYVWSGPEANGSTDRCITVGTDGTYTVRIIDANGCTNTCKATLTVNPPPPCSIEPASAAVCAGNTATFCATNLAGASYLWSGPEANGSTNRCITVGTQGTYTVRIIDANGCTNSCSATLMVNPTPPCSIEPASATVCQGNTAQFCATNLAGASYLWSGPEANGSTNRCITVGTQGTYTVRIIDANGCTNTCSATLTVNPVPECTISGETNVCVGATNCYTAASTPTGGSFSWQISGNGTITGPTTGNTVCVIAGATGSYTLTATVTLNGCTNTCVKTVTVDTCGVCITRTPGYWFTHWKAADTNCATLEAAIKANGNQLDLGFICLSGTTDQVLKQALGFFWAKKNKTSDGKGSQLCRARKQLAFHLIAAIANVQLLGTSPSSCTGNDGTLPGTLIEDARKAAACGDLAEIHRLTDLLDQFNNSGDNASFPNGLKPCKADPKGAKAAMVDPTTLLNCNAQTNNCAAGAACP